MDVDAGAHPALTALFKAREDRRQVRHRDRLHRPGDLMASIYLVTEGWFGRFRSGRDGGEAFTAVYMAGDVIGLDGLWDSRLRDEFVALSDGALLRVSVSDARGGIEAGGALALEIAELLAADSGFLREALFAVGTQSSHDRLRIFLTQTYRRLLDAKLIRPDADRFDLPLTQAQLGAVTGMTPVHVNRVLRSLRLDGLVNVRGGEVRITDLGRLRHEARLAPLVMA